MMLLLCACGARERAVVLMARESFTVTGAHVFRFYAPEGWHVECCNGIPIDVQCPQCDKAMVRA